MTRINNIQGLYLTVLGRQADAPGLTYWSGLLNQGRATFASIATVFLNTPEAQTRLGTLAPDAFIDLIYTSAFNRPADDAGKRFWTSKLGTQPTLEAKAQVVSEIITFGLGVTGSDGDGFRNKIEENNRLAVQSLYLTYLGRAADQAGQNYWVGQLQLKNGASLDSIATALATSNEAQQKYQGLSNDQFIDYIYNNAFGRNADVEGKQFWTNKLAQPGATKSKVVQEILIASVASTPDRERFEDKTENLQIVTNGGSLTITDNVAGEVTKDNITYTFTFAQAVTDFDAADITVTNGTKGTFNRVSGTVYTLLVTPTPNLEGDVTVTVGDKTAVQKVDTKAPSVATTSARDATTGNTTFTFTFSEAVTGFEAADVTVTNGTAGTFTPVSATVYTLVVTPKAGTQPTVRVNAGAALDAALNPSVVNDGSRPIVAITNENSQNGDILVTFTFSEAVTGFEAGDIGVTGGTAGTFTPVSATVYTLAVTPSANVSEVKVAVPEGIAVDADGNTNFGQENTIDNRRTFVLGDKLDNLIGTGGDDIFVGDRTTVQAADQINSGGGRDTFKYFEPVGVLPTLISVERVELIQAGSDINFTRLAGQRIEEVSLQFDPNLDISIRGLQDIEFSIEKVNNPDRDITANFGDATSASVTLSDSNFDDLTIAGAALATLNLESNSQTKDGVNKLDDLLLPDTLRTLNISGDGKVNIVRSINLNDTATTTVNASTNTGGVELSFNDGVVKFTGGSGNDAVAFNEANFNTSDTLDGGSGTDKLVLRDNAAPLNLDGTTANTLVAAVNAAKNIEILRLEDNDGNNATVLNNATVEANRITNISNYEFAVGTVTLRGAVNKNITLQKSSQLTLDGRQSIGLTLEDISTLRISSTQGTGDPLVATNITALNTSNGGLTIIVNNPGGTARDLTIAAPAFPESVTSPGITINGGNTADLRTDVNNVRTAQKIPDSLTGLTAPQLGALLGAFGADAFTAKLTATGTSGSDILRGAGGADTLNGGAGNDIIFGGGGNNTINGGEGNDLLVGGVNDTIDGGAGDDTIFGAGGRDTLTGGAGANTFVYRNADDSTSANVTKDAATFDTILDFKQGTDKIDLRGFATLRTGFVANLTDVQKAVNAANATELTAAVVNAANGVAAGTTIGVFVFGGNTYITSATDNLFIKLQGDYDFTQGNIAESFILA